MPIINYVPCNPTDYVLQGMEMSDQSAGSPRRETQLTTVNALVIDIRKALLTDMIAGDTDTEMIGDDGFLTRRAMRSLFDKNCMAVNARIISPCGADVQIPFGQRIMDEYLGSTHLWAIIGITKTGAGVALGNCRVVVYETGQMFKGGTTFVAEGMSDGSGNFTIPVPTNTAYELTAYLPGVPDVAGITVNNVTPVQVG